MQFSFGYLPFVYILLNKFNAAFNLLWLYLKVDSTAFQLLKKSLKQINLVQDRFGTTIDDLVIALTF